MGYGGFIRLTVFVFFMLGAGSAAADSPKVAVFEAQVAGLEAPSDGIGDRVTDLVAARLKTMAGVGIIPRAEVAASIGSDEAAGKAACWDATCRERIARKVGARLWVGISVQPRDDRCELRLQLIETGVEGPWQAAVAAMECSEEAVVGAVAEATKRLDDRRAEKAAQPSTGLSCAGIGPLLDRNRQVRGIAAAFTF